MELMLHQIDTIIAPGQLRGARDLCILHTKRSWSLGELFRPSKWWVVVANCPDWLYL